MLFEIFEGGDLHDETPHIRRSHTPSVWNELIFRY